MTGMKRGIRGIGIVILLAMGGLVCRSADYRVTTPEGFAVFDREQHRYRAISSDGVVVKVYAVANNPFGDAGMWGTAVEHYLKSMGYQQIVKKEMATSENLKGLYMEYLYKYNAEDYIYSLALFLHDKDIYLFQSGGQKKYYDKRRSSIMRSLNGLSLKKD